jgi:hypothetical protein
VLTDGVRRICAVRKVPEGWRAKRLTQFLSVVFKDHVLLDYDEQSLFRIERKLDFMTYDEDMFVLDKHEFERVLNFRAGMEKNRDEVLNDMESCGLFTDTLPIREAVGSRLTLLRRLSAIRKHPRYKDRDFLTKLKKECEKHQWPVKWSGEKIDVHDSDVEVLLRLLNDDRLSSLVTDGIYDVSAKKPVS